MQQPPYPPNGYPSNPEYPSTTGQYPPTYPGQTPPPGYPPQGYPQMPPGYPPNGHMYPPPQQQEQPAKKKKPIFKIGCGALVAVVALIIIISAVSNGGKSSDTSSTSGGSSSNTTNQQAPSQPQTWQTTHTYNGSGEKKTETITVPDDWKINWTCDPTSFDGMQYNVIIAVYNSDGTIADPTAINDMCKSGNTSGGTEEHQAGNVYLDIDSEGSWTITIQELK